MNKTTEGKGIKRKIRICSCGTPLIWTFRWPYCEYFCLNCGDKGGMFDIGESVELTKELKLKKRVVNKIWKSIRPILVCLGEHTMDNCKKCKSETNHRKHLSKKEIRNNKIGEKLLKSYLHIFI